MDDDQLDCGWHTRLAHVMAGISKKAREELTLAEKQRRAKYLNDTEAMCARYLDHVARHAGSTMMVLAFVDDSNSRRDVEVFLEDLRISGYTIYEWPTFNSRGRYHGDLSVGYPDRVHCSYVGTPSKYGFSGWHFLVMWDRPTLQERAALPWYIARDFMTFRERILYRICRSKVVARGPSKYKMRPPRS